MWAAPAVVLVLATIGTAVGTAIAQSLGLVPLIGRPTPGVAAYRALAPELGASLRVSLGVATAATVVAALIGFTVAVVATSGRRIPLAVASVTVPVPHLIGAAAVGLLLGDSGLLPRWLGVDSAWPPLVGGRWWAAVIIEYAWKEGAFIAVVVTGALAGRRRALDEAAASLGAGPGTRLRLVTLPLAAPTVILTSAIAFAYTVGSYEVPRLLGRPYPEPLAVSAVRLFRSIDLTTRPQAAALAVVTMTLAASVIVAALLLVRRTSLWR
ncbi:ABC transporter permease subunit [Williamsia sp. CHRR-6]|nr:ABC transporter permease subunit [Williamsia sp. CHRR-6]